MQTLCLRLYRTQLTDVYVDFFPFSYKIFIIMMEFLSAIDDGVALDVIDPDMAEQMQMHSLLLGHPSLIDIESLVSASGNAISCRNTPKLKPQTRFGRLLAKQIDLARYDDTSLVCCSKAEPTLMQSLGIYPQLPQSLQKLSNERKEDPSGPLICIVDRGKVVAVQKNHGEPSIYALCSRKKLGLVERTFSGSTIHFSPRSLATKSPVVIASTALYGTFFPIRQAVSVFSDSTRQHVKPYTATSEVRCEEILKFSHTRIIEAVKTASGSGVTIPVH